MIETLSFDDHLSFTERERYYAHLKSLYKDQETVVRLYRQHYPLGVYTNAKSLLTSKGEEKHE